MLQAGENVLLLLPYGVAKGVRFRPREAAERGGGGHDVLLVDEDPVGSLQERLKERMQVGDRLLAVLAANVGGDVRHRARSIEGDHRRKVIDAGWPQLLDVPPHAR